MTDELLPASLSGMNAGEGAWKRFPILPGGEPIIGNKRRKDLLPSVPWSLVAPHEKQAMKNHNQTLRRLAERHQGLSFCELAAVLEDREWRKMSVVEALAIIARKLVEAVPQ